MSPHQIIAVAVRLFAVWLTIYVGNIALSFYLQPASSEIHFGTWIWLLALGAAAVIILALWFFPLTVAHRLLSNPVSTPARQATPDTWLFLGCVVIGLWALSYALPALVSDCAAIYAYGSDYFGLGRGWVRVLYHLLEVAFAAWLIVGTAGFRRLVWWGRTAGISKSL